ncbi:hypothetical protein BX600DRAFT_446666 [Xylariales sp. PMI_506]|nr:hypothetical protein BX600DRAFT_446666 [Xylariales sp. PMI_506]
MVKILPPDPRKMLPSRADPEHRGRRKELEKKHGYGYVEPLVLGMIGITLAWNIENQVRKAEERKEKEADERGGQHQQQQQQRARGRSQPQQHRSSQRQDQHRDQQPRSGSYDPRRRRDDYSQPRVYREHGDRSRDYYRYYDEVDVERVYGNYGSSRGRKSHRDSW